MTPGDLQALEALNMRLDHTASVARLVITHAALDPDLAGALEVIAWSLEELAERIDCIVGTTKKDRALPGVQA